MDIQMEEYSTLLAESGGAFQLRAKSKRESSFPVGRCPARTSGRPRQGVAGPGTTANRTAGARSSRVEGLAFHHEAVWAKPSMSPLAARMVKQALTGFCHCLLKAASHGKLGVNNSTLALRSRGIRGAGA